MIVKLRQTLAFKIGMVVLASLALILGSCGVLTYFNQMAVYRRQCEASLREAGDFLGRLIEADKDDFVRYQVYFPGALCRCGTTNARYDIRGLPFAGNGRHKRHPYGLFLSFFCTGLI